VAYDLTLNGPKIQADLTRIETLELVIVEVVEEEATQEREAGEKMTVI